jgi:hypothetical protein
MKYIFWAIVSVIGYSLLFIKNILIMIWHFHYNPVVNKRQPLHSNKEWDEKLWDRFLGIDRKPY